jgi:hypothetical protein
MALGTDCEFDCFGHDTILYYRTSPEAAFYLIPSFYSKGSARPFGHIDIDGTWHLCSRLHSLFLDCSEEETSSILAESSISSHILCDLAWSNVPIH